MMNFGGVSKIVAYAKRQKDVRGWLREPALCDKHIDMNTHLYKNTKIRDFRMGIKISSGQT